MTASSRDAFRVRRATPGDAEQLADFAVRIFAETFGAANDPSDLALHLGAAFGVAQQTRELEDPDYITLIAEDEEGLAGFAQVRRGATPECVEHESPVELYRFYVASRWHGLGLARALMDRVHEAAHELGGASVWLSVWERNPRAIAFYGKCGFVDVGSTDFFVGRDRQKDRVMIAPVALM